MRAPNLEKLDLNLLLVFDALMKERNVTAAAANLGLTQPTLSHALNRLRQTCGDPLFVRTPKGMQPTAYALSINFPISSALDLIRRSLAPGGEFDPASSTRLFRIVMTDIGVATFMPPLVAKLRQQAPKIRIEVSVVPVDQYRETLQSGDVDLAVGQMPPIVAGFYQQRLIEDRHVVMAARNHPRLGGPLTVETYLREAHLRVMLSGRPQSVIDQVLQDMGLQRDVAVTVPHYTAVAPLVCASELLATVPSRIFDAMSRSGQVQKLELPFETPPIVVRQFWHERNHGDPGLMWLRQIIHDLLAAPAPLVRQKSA
jgi:DNA-binding transcriptional LysR family regulator